MRSTYKLCFNLQCRYKSAKTHPQKIVTNIKIFAAPSLSKIAIPAF